jgi:ribosomal protein S18 acetylase RimI-like enzyme
MRRERLDDLAAPQWPAGYDAATFPRPEAIRHFIAIYDASFGPQPWYQPFSRGEVAEILDSEGDLLFAITAGMPVGVAWMRAEEESGAIEPIGIAPAHQGKGVGRALLVTALLAMHRRGARTASLGVWKDNAQAIALYRQVGFRHTSSRTFLAYDFG